MEMCNVKRVGK